MTRCHGSHEPLGDTTSGSTCRDNCMPIRVILAEMHAVEPCGSESTNRLPSVPAGSEMTFWAGSTFSDLPTLPSVCFSCIFQNLLTLHKTYWWRNWFPLCPTIDFCLRGLLTADKKKKKTIQGNLGRIQKSAHAAYYQYSTFCKGLQVVFFTSCLVLSSLCSNNSGKQCMSTARTRPPAFFFLTMLRAVESLMLPQGSMSHDGRYCAAPPP